MDYITHSQTYCLHGVFLIARSFTGQVQSAWVVPTPELANGLLLDDGLYAGNVQPAPGGNGFYLSQSKHQRFFFPADAQLIFIVPVSGPN